MDPKKLKSIFSFFEKNTKHRTPLKYKLLYDYDSITKEDLEIKGSLWLRDSDISKLPDNLKVGGNLSLSHTKVSSLPDNLEVGESLYLTGSNISNLPNTLKVKGNLWLRYTPLYIKYAERDIKKMVPLVEGGIYV